MSIKRTGAAEEESGGHAASGNPVFDFDASFRRRATFVQKGLLALGLLALFAGVIACVADLDALGGSSCGAFTAAAGAAMFLAGIVWGYYWRARLRKRFRETYGPD